MIELSEEPYDGEVGSAFIAALLEELNVRYAHEGEDMTEEELAAADAEYLAEVTPALVARPQGTFVVARRDGEPVACGALKPYHEAPATAEIKRMYTIPAARRQGISWAVLDRLEEVARELGYQRMQLETGTEQPEAVALYEKHGWHRIEPYGRYRESPSSVCFAKELEPG